MKKIIFLFWLSCLAYFAISCSDENEEKNNTIEFNGEKYTPSYGLIIDYSNSFSESHYSYGVYLSDGNVKLAEDGTVITENASFLFSAILLSKDEKVFTLGDFPFGSRNELVVNESMMINPSFSLIRGPILTSGTSGSSGNIDVLASKEKNEFELNINILFEDQILTGSCKLIFEKVKWP